MKYLRKILALLAPLGNFWGQLLVGSTATLAVGGPVDGSPELLRLATQFVLQLGQHGDRLGDDGRPQGSDVQLAGPQ